MIDVLVVGAAGVDTCVYLAGDSVPEADASFTDDRDGVGQAGGYAARGYAALGYRTAYLGPLGEDWAGAMVRDVLGADGVELGWCFTDPAGTARSVNLVTADGRRRGFYDGRGNPALRPDPALLDAALDGPVRLCHVNIPDWARQVLPLARRRQIPVLTDLQDVHDPADPYRLDFVDGSDVICFSAANGVDPDATMHAYWARNPRLVLLAGLGADGCAVGVAGHIQHLPPPRLDLAVVDTNGAGDALAVGFATGYLFEGLPADVAALRGQRAARITCGQRVPKTRLATRADLAASGG